MCASFSTDGSVTARISLPFLDKLINLKRFTLLIWLASLLHCTSGWTRQSYSQSRRWSSNAPCAWLERGGLFNIPKYYSATGPLMQLRHSCTGRNKCPRTWLPIQDTQALTFKLIGTDDMRDYEFQAQFCSPLYSFQHRYCTAEEGEIAFEMRQVGTWLILDRINCRCLGVADVERYGYSKGILPRDKIFRGDYFQMTCAKRPECGKEQFCYVETPSTDGYIYGGRVPCICPKEYYCPIYFIRNKRIAQTNDDGRVVSYGLRCKRRMY